MLVTSSGTIPIPSITIPLSNIPFRTIGSTSPEQPPNTFLPMLVTLDGIAMLVRLLQPENAESPMLVTLEGISMLVRLLQP